MATPAPDDPTVPGSLRVLGPSLLPERVGGWTVVRQVGRGGMASVYEVVDNVGNRRALKLLHGGAVPAMPGGVSDELEKRFRREFRALSRLQHPNIARVYEWGQYEGRPYYVMELVQGEDLRVVVELWQSLPPQDRYTRVRAVLLQVAQALEYIHLRGLVHRDVTPSNVMVVGDPVRVGPGAVRLMDFGVVKDLDGGDATMHGEVLGTVAYAAPEQISGGAVDSRTDLYALGAVLYFMVTGRRPFHARTAAGYLDKHLHAAARPPREIVPEIPPLLEEICLRLLQKDPGDRYASATHLLHVIEGTSHTAATVDPSLWPPALAGRSEEVAAIHNAVTAVTEGQGGVIVLTGPTGSGKTRLLQLARSWSRRVGVPCLRLRVTPGESPLRALKVVVDLVAAERGSLPPVIERFYAGDAEGGAPIERSRVHAGFRELISGGPPRVIEVDDVHLADAVTIELLEYLIRTMTGIAREPLLWIISATAGVQDLRLEGLLHGGSTEVVPQRLVLKPLDGAAVEEIVLSLVPDSPATRALARRLQVEGEGSPAYIAEMLRGLVDDRRIVGPPGGRSLAVEEATVARMPLPIPRSVREALHARLDALPSGARAVAEVLAVARQELSTDLLAALVTRPDLPPSGGRIPTDPRGASSSETASSAAGLTEAGLFDALDALVDAGLVRERRGEVEERYELASSRTRDLLLAELDPERTATLHRRVGLALEQACGRQLHLVVEALAVHFEAGSVPGKAFPYLLRAGQRLQGRSFAAEAEDHYSRAIALEGPVREHIPLDEADRQLCEALILRAETNDHLGRRSAQAEDLSRAAKLARGMGDDRLCCRALAAQGSLARQSEDLERAEQLSLESLRYADRAGDPGLRVLPLQALAGVRWARRDLEGARRHWSELLSLGESRRDDRALAYGYNGLGLAALCRGEPVEARRAYEKSVEILERLGLLGPLSVARVNLVEIHHFTGNLRRGLELAERVCAHARETRHRLGMSRGRCFRSMLLVDLARTTEALADAVEAVTIARELGDGDEEVACQVMAIRAAWATGDVDTVRRFLHEIEPVITLHDAEGFRPLVDAWWARVAARDQDHPRAKEFIRRALATSGARWPYQEVRLELTLARVYQDLGDRGEARRLAEAALRRADAASMRFYSLKAHCLAAANSDEEATVARHGRVAEALARSLTANLAQPDAERFLAQMWLMSIVERR